MTSGSSEGELMSLPQVAKYLGLAERTIYLWAQQGRIPAFKLGSAWRFRRSAVDGWLETQRTGPAPQERSYLTDPVPPPPSNYRTNKARDDAEAAMIDECEQDILRAMLDDDRDVWITEQFEERYGAVVAAQAIDRLRKAKRITVAEEEGLRGPKVKVIRRR